MDVRIGDQSLRRRRIWLGGSSIFLLDWVRCRFEPGFESVFVSRFSGLV